MEKIDKIFKDLGLSTDGDENEKLDRMQECMTLVLKRGLSSLLSLPSGYSWVIDSSDGYFGLQTPYGFLVYNGYDAKAPLTGEGIKFVPEVQVGAGSAEYTEKFMEELSVKLDTPSASPKVLAIVKELEVLEDLVKWFRTGYTSQPKDIFNYLSTKDLDVNVQVDANLLRVSVKRTYLDFDAGTVESETTLFFVDSPEVSRVDYTLSVGHGHVLGITGRDYLILGLLNPAYDLPSVVSAPPKTIRPGFEIIKEIVPKKVIKGTKFTCGALRPSVGFEANMSFEDETTKLELKDLTNEMGLSITLHGCRSLFDVFKGLN